MGFPDGPSGKKKKSTCQCRRQMQVQFLGWEDPLEEGMVTHSSIYLVLSKGVDWQTTSVFLPWEPHEQYEKAKW